MKIKTEFQNEDYSTGTKAFKAILDSATNGKTPSEKDNNDTKPVQAKQH